MPSLVVLRRHCCFSSRQLAEKHLGRARQLVASQELSDVESALCPLESALKLWPQWEKALELKARSLLYLKRFKEVANMLQEYIPSLMSQTFAPESPVPKEKQRLLSDYLPEEDFESRSIVKYFSVAKLKKKLTARLSKRYEKQEWRYVVLGQACCHLGMMEDAMILLQSGKRTASAASRRQSNCMREDNFCPDSMTGAESDLVNQMLGNIKFLLRRRTAALAALEAGLYSESVRHFSKIVEGRKGTPQGFVAECYLHRAIAYQAMGRVVDAIADCNRTLALNPTCTRALSARASLYEMVKCFPECLQDLQQLKMIYEAALRYQLVPEPRWMIRKQSTSDIDFEGGLDYINSKIMTTRQRLSTSCTIDPHTILDLPRSCGMADVERAYLLISLKHRPDKAAYFVDRCEFVDDRDIDTVKEEARSSALRLSQLIHKAYTGLLSSIVDEEVRKQNELQAAEQDERNHEDGSHWSDYNASLEQIYYYPFVREQDDELGRCQGMDVRPVYHSQWEGEEELEPKSSFAQEPITSSEMCLEQDGSKATETVVLEAFTGFNFFGSRQEELVLMDASANVFSTAAITCRELANVGAILSQALCPEPSSAWMNTTDWSLAAHALPVT